MATGPGYMHVRIGLRDEFLGHDKEATREQPQFILLHVHVCWPMLMRSQFDGYLVPRKSPVKWQSAQIY